MGEEGTADKRCGAATAGAAGVTALASAITPAITRMAGKLPDLRTDHHLLVVNWPGGPRLPAPGERGGLPPQEATVTYTRR